MHYGPIDASKYNSYSICNFVFGYENSSRLMVALFGSLTLFNRTDEKIKGSEFTFLIVFDYVSNRIYDCLVPLLCLYGLSKISRPMKRVKSKKKTHTHIEPLCTPLE
jgi:hypothetical protein